MSMPQAQGEQAEVTFLLKNEEATKIAGNDLAVVLCAPCIIHLVGDLGAGKTALARAIIQSLADDAKTEVPSPTFSLVQHYRGVARGNDSEIVHADLYRINDAEEVIELGLNEPQDDQIRLIEWPEKGVGELAPEDIILSLDTQVNEDGTEGRLLTIKSNRRRIDRIERSFAIRRFLNGVWSEGAERRFLLGDASTRSYETASIENQTRIVMNAPRQPDGPVIRDGKPYSQIAHLAEDVSAFVGVGNILKQAGMVVPEIYGADLDQGLLLISDLGSGSVIDENRQPIRERYMAAAEMLAHLHSMPVSSEVEVAPGKMHLVPDYDRAAMMIEVELLTDWYLPAVSGQVVSERRKSEFEAHWNDLINLLKGAERHLVLRDFHSPNILWQDRETDHRRIGLIDFQDAVIGPCAYDVASLAQDARVDVSEDLEARIVDTYVSARQRAEQFDAEAFRRHYAIMATQRATKIMGIFIRLDRRDGKPAYLRHLPRIEAYLARNLTHPALHAYRDWLHRHGVFAPSNASESPSGASVTNPAREPDSSFVNQGE